MRNYEEIKSDLMLSDAELMEKYNLEAVDARIMRVNMMIAARDIEKRQKQYVIPFYNPDDEFGEFSNWYKCDFEFAGRRYSSAEQYLMVQKAMVFHAYPTAEAMFRTDDPGEIKRMGRNNIPRFDPDFWDAGINTIIMRQGLRAKFQQNDALLTLLLGTGDKILAEATHRDMIWSCGIDAGSPDVQDVAKWKGKNLLGQTLMQVRVDLRMWKTTGKQMEYISHIDDQPNELWEMTFAQLRQIPHVWEIVKHFHDVALADLRRRDNNFSDKCLDDMSLEDMEFDMRTNMGGGVWVGQFYEMKQELFDWHYYGII